MTPPGNTGKVYLIGAGPGDIELLTLKAVRCIGEADVILLDSLANKEVLQFAKPSADIIEVGKRGGRHSVRQCDIETRMVSLAKEGLTVCRIKGGDPSVFARGGEELEALRANHIICEIVPGITAASGICASMGISLTHRDLSHAVLFLTGPHFEPPAAHLILPPLSSFAGTIVVYMGLKNAPDVCRELLERGLPPATPSMAVQSGTLPDERSVLTRLDSLSSAIEAARLESPVLLIIGEVVALSPQYAISETAVTGRRHQ